MKNKFIFLTLMLLSIGFIISCSKDNDEDILSKIEKINLEETYPETHGQLETKYEDLSNMVVDADAIVKIKVLEQNIELLDGYPQTHTKVEIEQIEKGFLNIGDVIEVIEEGGTDGKVLGNIPQLNDETNYILFLTEHNGNYYVLGAFQGRFIEREGYLFQQATVDTKLSKYTPMTTDGFFDMVYDILE